MQITTIFVLSLLVISCYSSCKEQCRNENDACIKAGPQCVTRFIGCSRSPTMQKMQECFAPFPLANALYLCEREHRCPIILFPKSQQIFNQKQSKFPRKQ